MLFDRKINDQNIGLQLKQSPKDLLILVFGPRQEFIVQDFRFGQLGLHSSVHTRTKCGKKREIFIYSLTPLQFVFWHLYRKSIYVIITRNTM